MPRYQGTPFQRFQQQLEKGDLQWVRAALSEWGGTPHLHQAAALCRLIARDQPELHSAAVAKWCQRFRSERDASEPDVRLAAAALAGIFETTLATRTTFEIFKYYNIQWPHAPEFSDTNELFGFDPYRPKAIDPGQ